MSEKMNWWDTPTQYIEHEVILSNPILQITAGDDHLLILLRHPESPPHVPYHPHLFKTLSFQFEVNVESNISGVFVALGTFWQVTPHGNKPAEFVENCQITIVRKKDGTILHTFKIRHSAP